MTKYLKYTGLTTFILTLSAIVFGVGHTFALSGGQFSAGRIIDDFVFTNSNTMSVQDIQNFLNAKVPACDSWGTQTYSGTTRASYSRARGYKMPLTCLKDYYENPNTLANNLTVTDGQTAPIPAGAESAAQLIKDVSVQYNVNPEVLLVLLQKEQGLATDDWPWPTQFQKATGYGCPDTAACNSQYYGFYNQIANAAWQFNYYASHPTSYNYRSGITRSIAWSPSSSCGGANVSIQDQSTADLYNYTPYQPNGAALGNLTGTGDSCSSYGNRNFWYYFSTWFGTTYANDTGTAHPIGTLITDGQRVYMMEAAGRQWITSPAVFNSYGYVWSSVMPASTGDLNMPISSASANLASGTLASDGDGSVYIITLSGGIAQKQWLSYGSFTSLGYNWSQVQQVAPSDLPASTIAGVYASSQHPGGALIAQQGNVYLIDQSAKHYVSALAFASNYYHWNSLVQGTDADASLATGAPVDIHNGAILYSGGSIYVTESDTNGVLKQPIGPWECYADRLHYNSNFWYNIPSSGLPTRTGSLFTC